MLSLCAENVDHIKLHQYFKSGIINYSKIEMIHTMKLIQTFFWLLESTYLNKDYIIPVKGPKETQSLFRYNTIL